MVYTGVVNKIISDTPATSPVVTLCIAAGRWLKWRRDAWQRGGPCRSLWMTSVPLDRSANGSEPAQHALHNLWWKLMGTLLWWPLLMRSHCPANSLQPSPGCWNSYPARCPSADFAVPRYGVSSTMSSLPRMQRLPYHRMVFWLKWPLVNQHPSAVVIAFSQLPSTSAGIAFYSLNVCIGIFHNCVKCIAIKGWNA